ncbi:hypothetical protein [Tannockella kyphosi]|uniref:hypothetical protein n=1 Tax=Tannockella kyphosi TaxID=2899121 RepID=UPI002012181B|nr:hypothetical protein [Tannockella kyphosi]
MELTKEFGNAKVVHDFDEVIDKMDYIIIDDVLYFQISESNKAYEKIQAAKEISLVTNEYSLTGRCKEVGKTIYNSQYMELMKKYFSFKQLKEERLFIFIQTYENHIII